MQNTFTGLLVPLITPFKENGEIDFSALKRLIEYCSTNGADGFVALGTTAEAPTLSDGERNKILSLVIEHSDGKPVIAGTGSNCTDTAIKLTQQAKELGASGVLSVCPYYNKPSKTGIIKHFSKISASTSLPVLLYNVPTRTAVDLDIYTIERLSKIDNIVGIKQASPRRESFTQLTPLLSGSFAILNGSDELTLHALDAGCVGLISAAANLLPRTFADILQNYFSENKDKADEIFNSYKPLIEGMYIETNPAPLKYALSKILGIKNVLRLPMCPITRKNEQIIDSLLKNYI